MRTSPWAALASATVVSACSFLPGSDQTPTAAVGPLPPTVMQFFPYGGQEPPVPPQTPTNFLKCYPQTKDGWMLFYGTNVNYGPPIHFHGAINPRGVIGGKTDAYTNELAVEILNQGAKKCADELHIKLPSPDATDNTKRRFFRNLPNGIPGEENPWEDKQRIHKVGYKIDQRARLLPTLGL